jgi:IS605 OrfB family transposase
MSIGVVTVKLTCDRVTSRALADTLRVCNEAANAVSKVAFERRLFKGRDLRPVTYGLCRNQHGLGAQAAQNVIRKVADAYNSGDKKFRRSRLRRFRPMSAQPFDRRNLSINTDTRTISIWTTAGRLKQVPFAGSDSQVAAIAAALAAAPLAESDLLHRNGAFYLAVTVTVGDTPMNAYPAGFLGVDLGIVNIATTSDGTRHSGAHLNRNRHRHQRLRTKLQQKGTRSAKRLLAKSSGRQARFARDVNHRISKSIVAEAQRTGHGIALEELEGIRSRARSRKPQRATLHTWSYHQLGTFIAYKATRAGVPVVHVNPAYTSQRCSHCGNTTTENRPTQAEFSCTACGFVDHADRNAAVNIAQRGADDWAVSHAAERHTRLAA